MKYEVAAIVTLTLTIIFARGVGATKWYEREGDVLAVLTLILLVSTILLVIYGVVS